MVGDGEVSVPWGGDYWGETNQKRRAWIVEVLCNGTVEFETPAHLVAACQMLDTWITDGHKDGIPVDTGNVSHLPRRPR